MTAMRPAPEHVILARYKHNLVNCLCSHVNQRVYYLHEHVEYKVHVPVYDDGEELVQGFFSRLLTITVHAHVELKFKAKPSSLLLTRNNKFQHRHNR